MNEAKNGTQAANADKAKRERDDAWANVEKATKLLWSAAKTLWIAALAALAAEARMDAMEKERRSSK